MGSVCVANMGEKEMCTEFVVETKRKRPLGRLRFRWDDNSKFYLKEVDGRVQSGFVWLRRGTCGRAL